jgi:uncharacterized protein (TIGR03435 family)
MTTNSGKELDRFFSRALKASPGAVHDSERRVLGRLRSEAAEMMESPIVLSPPVPRYRDSWRLVVTAAGAAAIILVVILAIPSRTEDAGAHPVSVSDIESRKPFRSGDATGMTLTLSDQTRIEMRMRTELSFERAPDGVRIRLAEGSILVNAAKQRAGHLYVQTKDLTVSVVGTVFLVKAEKQRSRLAVVEGEVHVIGGAAMERLLPGEQVASNSEMTLRSVSEEISWSRHAGEQIALLQRSAVPAEVTPGTMPRDTFDVVSIRPSAASSGGEGARGGGSPRGQVPCPGSNGFAMQTLFELNPGRVIIRNVPIYYWIGLAYGNGCPAPDTLVGGPDWIRTDWYDLQATLPAGTPNYTKEQWFIGNAPVLQRMLQTMLADRFKLVLKRDVKDIQGYNLVLAQEGKLKLSAAQTAGTPPEARQSTPGVAIFPLLSTSISRLAGSLQPWLGRPIVDRTGLTGLYDIWLEFPEIGPAPQTDPAPGPNRGARDRLERMKALLPSKLESTTGLRLEPAKVPVETLVIVSVERPSDN